MSEVQPAHPIVAISNSEVSSFKGCKRKWNCNSNNRRNLQPDVPDAKLWMGTGVHYAMEHYYGPNKRRMVDGFREWAAESLKKTRAELGQTLTAETESELLEARDMGLAMAEHYELWAAKHDDFEPVQTEFEFEVPIPDTRVELTDDRGAWLPWVLSDYPNPLANDAFIRRYNDIAVEEWNEDTQCMTVWAPALYVGKMDGIVREKKNPSNYWLLEHKTRAQKLNDEILLLDEQTSKYAWAATTLIDAGRFPQVGPGTRLRGVLYNVLRKAVPREPELLLKGGLSKNKAIDTTEEVYLRAIQRHNLNPADYADILGILGAKGNTFFTRVQVRRGPRELELVGERLRHEFEDIQRYDQESMAIDNPKLYPSPSEDCGWKCSFRDLCLVANYGGDTEDLVRQRYRQQKSRGANYTNLNEKRT